MEIGERGTRKRRTSLRKLAASWRCERVVRLEKAPALAIHDREIAEHGGSAGLARAKAACTTRRGARAPQAVPREAASCVPGLRASALTQSFSGRPPLPGSNSAACNVRAVRSTGSIASISALSGAALSSRRRRAETRTRDSSVATDLL